MILDDIFKTDTRERRRVVFALVARAMLENFFEMGISSFPEIDAFIPILDSFIEGKSIDIDTLDRITNNYREYNEKTYGEWIGSLIASASREIIYDRYGEDDWFRRLSKATAVVLKGYESRESPYYDPDLLISKEGDAVIENMLIAAR